MFDPVTFENTMNDPKPEPRSFTAVEVVFAWLCFAAGYAFCRVFPVTSHPLGGFLFTLALLTAAAVVLRLKGCSFGVMPCVAAVSAVALSASLIFTSNGFIHFFAYVYSLATVGYFIFAVTGNCAEVGFSDMLVRDYFKALVIMPFVSYVDIFRAAFSGKKGNSKFALKILVGVSAAVVPTCIVIALLSYDSGFVEIIKNIFDIGFREVFSHIFSLLLGLPIGMYVYGLFISSAYRKYNNVMSADECRNVASKLRIAPAATVLSAIIPVLVIYVIFFISQWKYYISGFVGVLPDMTSYADYAREGFFQLCAVSVINLLMLIAVSVLMRRKEQKPTLLQRVISIVISLFTLLLIATAVAKMAMYIDCYGLTPKRVYATWFMAVIALVFIIVIIKQFLSRMRVVAVCCAMCVVAFAALSFADTDTLIAEYNVDRYIDDTLDNIDINAMESLGDSALPALIRLAEYLDDQNGTDITDYVGKSYSDDYDADYDTDYEIYYCDEFYRIVVYAIDDLADEHELSLFSFTVPAIKAEAALKSIGLKGGAE